MRYIGIITDDHCLTHYDTQGQGTGKIKASAGQDEPWRAGAD